MTIDGAILLVDGDAAMREMLADHLGGIGVSSASAAGVAEALALLAQQEFFAVVSHLRLGPVDGFALLEANREGPPVILMSSFASDDVEHEAMSRGAAAFLRKPFPPSDLLRLLTALAA